ncbi:MAG: cytochrome C [Proteobacteria bacterium]|nr:cytochrome C [Pseudomonadota bacterium]MBU1737772.1 cytochrome C [Pseudomonadota bacterium]
MKKLKRLLLSVVFLAVAVGLPAMAMALESKCVECHKKVTPNIVKDYMSGAMGKSGTVECASCHGAEHTTADDAIKAVMPTEKTCQQCHEKQHGQYMSGKHMAAWIAMSAMPKTGFQPHAYIQGLKGCGGCHKIGVRDEDSRAESRYGSPCDSCHTRHKFSKEEANKPEACRTCHMGFDHPQWEMWSSSKHGIIYQTEGDTGRAPKCQTCHMENGDHRVMTSWGFLALRLPEADEEWMGYRTSILKGLHVLDPEGKPTGRLEVVKAGMVARLTAESWQAERDRMVEVCSKCHSRSYALTNLENADAMIKEADKLMAEAVEIVAFLYKKGILQPEEGKAAYPDMLTFYDAKSPIEQTLYVMFLEHRMRAFQGAFHMNPDYTTWYGLAEMKKDIVEIRSEAKKLIMESERNN